ncbi:MAG: hypothetical protein ACYC27_07970 [Armatimonadota bacterium]
MKPGKASLIIGILMLKGGVLMIGWWLYTASDNGEGWTRGFLSILVIFAGVSMLLPGTAQLIFNYYYSRHSRKPGDWEVWTPVVGFLSLWAAFILALIPLLSRL